MLDDDVLEGRARAESGRRARNESLENPVKRHGQSDRGRLPQEESILSTLPKKRKKISSRRNKTSIENWK